MNQESRIHTTASPRKPLLKRMREGLKRSAQTFSDGVTDIFTRRKPDAETLQELEDFLIMSDMGVEQSTAIIETLGRESMDRTRGKADAEEQIRAIREKLAQEITGILQPAEQPLRYPVDAKPAILLFVGANGAGKTTTIGKIGAKLREQGQSVMLVAGDTFRAAAADQLRIWGERIGAPVVETQTGSDASGLVYQAIERARAEGTDVLLIDTAGRLHNKAGLMAELEKIIRVIKKLDPGAPHQTLLVLDATTGQNAMTQAGVFTRTAGVSGLIMTKLDGTARGGILVAIAGKLGLPVHFIGIGENVNDLQEFRADPFARALAGAGPPDETKADKNQSGSTQKT